MKNIFISISFLLTYFALAMWVPGRILDQFRNELVSGQITLAALTIFSLILFCVVMFFVADAALRFTTKEWLDQ
ncbi:hypothetical protein M2128_000117 [Polynucleobacter sphagniphilus]|nr:hypothetical protein [Polynucleobacter sphagniphilus]